MRGSNAFFLGSLESLPTQLFWDDFFPCKTDDIRQVYLYSRIFNNIEQYWAFNIFIHEYDGFYRLLLCELNKHWVSKFPNSHACGFPRFLKVRCGVVSLAHLPTHWDQGRPLEDLQRISAEHQIKTTTKPQKKIHFIHIEVHLFTTTYYTYPDIQICNLKNKCCYTYIYIYKYIEK